MEISLCIIFILLLSSPSIIESTVEYDDEGHPIAPLTDADCPSLFDFKKTGSRIRGKRTIINVGFQDGLLYLNDVAKDCGVRIYVTNSYEEGSEADNFDSHYIGHAVDINLIVDNKSKWCNARCLKYIDSAPEEVQCFLNKIQAGSEIHWDWRDPAHFDDDFSGKRKGGPYLGLIDKISRERGYGCYADY